MSLAHLILASVEALLSVDQRGLQDLGRRLRGALQRHRPCVTRFSWVGSRVGGGSTGEAFGEPKDQRNGKETG